MYARDHAEEIELDTHGRGTMEHANLSSSSLPEDDDYADQEEFATLSKLQKDAINRRVVRKLDFILLPFLCLFFLVNSLDRTNIGNAETARFTDDAGLQPHDLNIAVALFFSFFVALQPVGAACGRRFGMVRWVPGCMFIWGICTSLHVWVTAAWQLYTLRIVIGILEAGFYPTTVAYLSLFYTRYEFAKRLGVFYGQYAVAGALGGFLAYGVLNAFPNDPPDFYTSSDGWKSWQVLFLIEGGLTVVIAAAGFFWLPKNAETAWFLSAPERKWASSRIAKDRTEDSLRAVPYQPSHMSADARDDTQQDDVPNRDDEDEAERLLPPSSNNHNATNANDVAPATTRSSKKPSLRSRPSDFTDAKGLHTRDVVAAFTDPKVYTLLFLNILSSIPATAFTVFLPMIVQEFGMHPAQANLYTAPPFLTGAAVLLAIVYISDRTRQRILPLLLGLAILLIGLLLTLILMQQPSVTPRYVAVCFLVAGSFVASPLTIAWLAGNVEKPGKRAVVLGINGWGNLSGVFSSLLFDRRFRPSYKVPFFVTFALVAVAFAGYVAFRIALVRESKRRRALVAGWSREAVEAEMSRGKGPLPVRTARIAALKVLETLRGADYIGDEDGRVGEEKVTFIYGL